MLVHELQQTEFDLRLVQKCLFVLDDLNGNPFLLMVVVGLHHLQRGSHGQTATPRGRVTALYLRDIHHLSKRAFPNQWVYLIAVQPLFSVFNNVVVVVVVVAIVVNFSLLLGAAVFRRDLLGPPLLLRIIHLETREAQRYGKVLSPSNILKSPIPSEIESGHQRSLFLRKLEIQPLVPCVWRHSVSWCVIPHWCACMFWWGQQRASSVEHWQGLWNLGGSSAGVCLYQK